MKVFPKHLVRAIPIVFILLPLSHGQDATPAPNSGRIESILEEAKRALKRTPGTGSAETTPKQRARPQSTKSQNKTQESPHATDGLNASAPEEAVTQPLPPTEAHSILAVDLKALAREREPQDPHFVAHLMAGTLDAHSDYRLTKDDDTFQLAGDPHFSGGMISLSSDWRLIRFWNENLGFHFLLDGSGGYFSGEASIQRRGVQNKNTRQTVRIAPFSLGAGLEVDWRSTIRVGASYAPTMHLISLQGLGQTDTLSRIISGDRGNFFVNYNFSREWDVQIEYIQNGIFNPNLSDRSLLLGIGYAISG